MQDTMIKNINMYKYKYKYNKVGTKKLTIIFFTYKID